jgi:hypothetical protein
MADIAPGETPETLAQLAENRNTPANELCRLVASFPNLAMSLGAEQPRQGLWRYLECIATAGDGRALSEAKRRGFITPANIFELFSVATRVYAEGAAVDWFARNFRFSPAEAERIVEGAREPTLSAVAAMAKKLPLGRRGHTRLLKEMQALVLRLDLAPFISRGARDFDASKYPLLAAYVKAAKDRPQRHAKSCRRGWAERPFTAQKMEQYEQTLRKLGWLLTSYERLYGRAALEANLVVKSKWHCRGFELPALLEAYRRTARP